MVGTAGVRAGETELTGGLLLSAPNPGLVQRGGSAVRTAPHPELLAMALGQHCVEAEDSKTKRLWRQGTVQEDS